MKPITKNTLKSIVIVGMLFLTYACGHNSYDSSDYKAESMLGDSSDPATITNEVSSPSEMSVGDVYMLTFDNSGKATINFEETDQAAQFILAVSSIDTVQTSHTVQLSDESATPEELASLSAGLEDSKWKTMDATDALDQQLRAIESVMSIDRGLEKATPSFNATGAMKAMVSKSVPSVGDVESFKVLAGLSSLSSYRTVEAQVKCVGDNVIFYVDTQVAENNPSDLTDSDVTALCDEFDRVAGIEIEMFGEPSDVNGDGRVAVLMTPQVNRLGAMGGGIITGFFFANDLYASSNSTIP